MSYKDRECYLGASEMLGYLDKGGKWRKRDWWVGADDQDVSSFMLTKSGKTSRSPETRNRASQA